ncbi:MAG: GH25 family lysozyme [Myxococcota bacterium]|nr:GH25 family lysozyme [Myxococcota bacterium]
MREGIRNLLVAAAVILVLAVVGLVHWNRPGVDRFPVRGVDVSHHQGAVDWPRVAQAEVHFAFIKASEGGDHRDTRFEENWSEAGKAGIVRGAYHFFTFCTPGAVQADHFLDVAPPALGVLPPAVDVEFAGNCKSWTSVDDIRRELQVLLRRLEAAWGRAPVLYITSESEERVIRGHFDGYPVWIRSVFFRPGGREPTWLFWQYTDQGEIPGIETLVDLNVYRGQPSEIAELLR